MIDQADSQICLSYMQMLVRASAKGAKVFYVTRLEALIQSLTYRLTQFLGQCSC